MSNKPIRSFKKVSVEDSPTPQVSPSAMKYNQGTGEVFYDYSGNSDAGTGSSATGDASLVPKMGSNQPIGTDKGGENDWSSAKIAPSTTGVGSAVGSVAGAVIGIPFGPAGVSIGSMAGGALGSIYDYFTADKAQEQANAEGKAEAARLEEKGDKRYAEQKRIDAANYRYQIKEYELAKANAAEEKKYQRSLAAMASFKNALTMSSGSANKFMQMQQNRIAA